MIRILSAWGPATLWAAVLFYLSSRTWTAGPSLVPLNDKVIHGVLYGILGAALAFARRRSPVPPPHAALLGAGLLYALSDEYHQSFVPGRTPDPADWLADAAGLALGYAAGVRLIPRAPGGATDFDTTAEGRTE